MPDPFIRPDNTYRRIHGELVGIYPVGQGRKVIRIGRFYIMGHAIGLLKGKDIAARGGELRTLLRWWRTPKLPDLA